MVLEDIDCYTEEDLREALEEGESFDRARWLSDKSQKNFVRPLGPAELTAFCFLAKRTAAPGLPPVVLYGAILNENGLKLPNRAFALHRTVYFIPEDEWTRRSTAAAAGNCLDGSLPLGATVVYRDAIGPQALPNGGKGQ